MLETKFCLVFTFLRHVFCVFQGYYDNPKVCALYVMKGTLEGESAARRRGLILSTSPVIQSIPFSSFHKLALAT